MSGSSTIIAMVGGKIVTMDELDQRNRDLEVKGVGRRDRLAVMLLEAGGINPRSLALKGFGKEEVHQHLKSLGFEGFDFHLGQDLVTLTLRAPRTALDDVREGIARGNPHQRGAT